MFKKQGAVHVTVGKQELTCPFCAHTEFVEREIQLNTAGMSLLGLDWANKSARGFVCMQCGRVEMFVGDHVHTSPV